MTRDEFMKELAYLLQDIQDEDKEDALQYYMDYFDEAGPDREADVVRELGSPERIASIIRSDIAGNLKDGGEFTESGYKDERFRDPNIRLSSASTCLRAGNQSGRNHAGMTGNARMGGRRMSTAHREAGTAGRRMSMTHRETMAVPAPEPAAPLR